MSSTPLSPEAQPFQVFAPDHLIALGVVAVAGIALTVHARLRRGSKSVRIQEVILGILLLLRYPVGLFIGWRMNLLDLQALLPLHLCEVAAVSGGIALLTRHPLAAELTYFWGIAGTVNGLITPTVGFASPHPEFFLFFWLHGGVVVTAIYLVVGASRWPRPGAVLRTFHWSLGYAAVAGIVNAVIGTNYGFLREPPPTQSLIDVLGPWPWYILSLSVLAGILFALLYSPFYFLRKFGRGNA